MVKATSGVAPPSTPAPGKFPRGPQVVTHWAMAAAAAAADWAGADGAGERRARGDATETESRSCSGPQGLGRGLPALTNRKEGAGLCSYAIGPPRRLLDHLRQTDPPTPGGRLRRAPSTSMATQRPAGRGRLGLAEEAGQVEAARRPRGRTRGRGRGARTAGGSGGAGTSEGAGSGAEDSRD